MAAVQRALWYIESHSGQALALADVARAAGVSSFHLSRLFQAATGWSVIRYLRMRRLSQAAAALAAGATEILDVALSAGYGSHEAFTRAFRDAFGQTPEDVRKQGTLRGVDTVAPLRVIEEPAPGPALLRVETIGPLLLSGIGGAYRAGDTAGIPAQWQRLFGQRARHAPASPAYGVFVAGDDDGCVEYLAGHPVSRLADALPGHHTLRLAQRRYAVVRHTAHIGSIPLTWRAMMDDWLPAAGLSAVDAPDFERYDASFDPLSGEGGVDICVPIQ
jgi:AraC family transcriptional regulator